MNVQTRKLVLKKIKLTLEKESEEWGMRGRDGCTPVGILTALIFGVPRDEAEELVDVVKRELAEEKKL